MVRPLFFDYPNDDKAFDNVDNTFMLGDNLKVSPVLQQGVSGNYSSYFPAGKWYDLNSLTTLNPNPLINSVGDYYNLTDTPTMTNVHIKAGGIVPYQEFSKSNITTTEL